jgi:ABC-type lipoprotein export system ATPase subunit
VFKDFRAFRGERRISFVDPVTGTVRPLTVLAGSNGSGKTTLLDSIEALLAFKLNAARDDLIKEAQATGTIHLTLELLPGDLPSSARTEELFVHGKPEIVTFSAGERGGNGLQNAEQPSDESPAVQALHQAVALVSQGEAKLHGGLLYFPHDRRLAVTRGGSITPPEEKQEWLFRFSPSDKWSGSLEQLWVWQNYLDLEEKTRGRQRLAPFVEVVETVLGQDRRITISKGRAWVPVAWEQAGERPQVRLDQLPSGEQQALLLFGEIARRMRRGAVIMIDEVENSLHPTLQRLAMWNLERIAREWEAQVIVATHSLEVIHTVRGGAFINLDYPQDHFDLPLPDAEEGGRA